MSLSAGEVDRAWDKLGMEIKQTNDRHAIFRYEGRFILRTKRSFGSGKLTGKIPQLIRQQLRLNEQQFGELISCPLDRNGYIEILREKGLLAD